MGERELRDRGGHVFLRNRDPILQPQAPDFALRGLDDPTANLIHRGSLAQGRFNELHSCAPITPQLLLQISIAQVGEVDPFDRPVHI